MASEKTVARSTASSAGAGGRRLLPWSCWSAALLLTTFGFALAFRVGGPRGVVFTDNLTQLIAAGAAALAASWAARRRTGRQRAAWASVAVGAGAWTAGQGLWSFYELIAD